MLISAALIVKNEERCLARCLASLAPVVDEIVIVDTGSTDASLTIAESFGVKLLHRPWDGDFGAARNFGLEHVSGEVVLYIDADEYVSDRTPPDVREQVAQRGEHVAFRVLLRHRPQFTPLREYRMWENRPDIRFTGVIHETIVPDIRRVCDREERTVGLIDLLLEHDGYEGDQTAKGARDLPLLYDQLQNEPKRTYLWSQIGRIKENEGDVTGAREAFRTGIDTVRAHGSHDHADYLVYFDMIFSNATNQVPDGELVAEALSRFPRNALILWGASLDAFERKAYDEVERDVTALLSISEAEMADHALAIHLAIQPEWAPHLRGLARLELGDFEGAVADFLVAEAANPDHVGYRVKRQLAAARLAAAPH